MNPIEVNHLIFPRKNAVEVKSIAGILNVSKVLQKPLFVIVNYKSAITPVESNKGTLFFVLDGEVIYTFVKKQIGGKPK